MLFLSLPMDIRETGALKRHTISLGLVIVHEKRFHPRP